METKQIYQFTLDKEIEKVVESTRKNKKTGEETITKRKKKIKEPIEVQIKRPNRRELEEAELEYSIEMSKCIKKGILTKAMLGKKYSDTGGLFSEDDSDNYAKMYKDALDLQNEYVRLETAKKRTKAQDARFDSLKGEIAANRKEIIDFESNFQSLFDHTADVKAQNRVLLWYCLHLTYVYDEERDKFVQYFDGEDFEEKIQSYYDLEEADDPFYWDLIRKVTTVIAFWYFNQASSQEEFQELIEKAESGELTEDAEEEVASE
jgi:hypothetical protein